MAKKKVVVKVSRALQARVESRLHRLSNRAHVIAQAAERAKSKHPKMRDIAVGQLAV